jgi:hypothetical protein
MHIGSCVGIDASHGVAQMLMLPTNFISSHLYNLVHTIAHGIWLIVEYITPSLKERLLQLCAIALVCFVSKAKNTVNWTFICTQVTPSVVLQAVNLWFPMMVSNTSKWLMLMQHSMPCLTLMCCMYLNIDSLEKLQQIKNSDDPQACNNYKLKKESLSYAEFKRRFLGALSCFAMGSLFMLTIFSGNHGAAYIAGVLSGDACAAAKQCIVDPHEGLHLCILLSRLGTVSMLVCAFAYNLSPTQATVESQVSIIKTAKKSSELTNATNHTQLVHQTGEMFVSTAWTVYVMPLVVLLFAFCMYCVPLEDTNGIVLPLDEVMQSVTEHAFAKMLTFVYNLTIGLVLVGFLGNLLLKTYWEY